MDANHDVVIAGAGTAGSACAIALRQAGLRVCLVDEVRKDSFSVGESVPGATFRLLRRLGFDDLGDVLPGTHMAACTGNHSAWGSDRWTHQDALRNPEGGGWHCDRKRFDEALRNRAIALGASQCNGVVADVRPYPAGAEDGPRHQIFVTSGRSTKSLASNWIVDATGRRSTVSKKLGAAKVGLDQQMAAVAWTHPRGDDQDHATRIKSVADGWWYSARLPMGHRVVAFFGLPRHVADVVKQPSQFVDACNHTDLLPWQIVASDVASMRAADAGVGRLEHVAGDGWVAVGDAALGLDPLSSQGIFFALYSAVRGAESMVCHAAAGTATKQAAVLGAYQRAVDDVFHAHQTARRHHYASELRFVSHPYWKARLDGLAGGPNLAVPRPP